MSKSEEAAHAAYPNYWKSYPFETNKEARAAFVKGYEQAEKEIKDTLLEWAKKMKEQVSIGLNEYDMGEENGKAEMLNKLIEKIQSL